MSSVFARGHRICRSTRLRKVPPINPVCRRHLVVPVQSQWPYPHSSPFSFDTSSKTQNEFQKVYEFVQGGLGPKPAVPLRYLGNTVWNRLFMLSKTPEQLESVMEMSVPGWRDMRRAFRTVDAEVFARRCEDLECPLLALRIFSNHSKYAFPISSDLAGLQLIHSLHLKYPLQETITAAALFELYKLKPITSSLPGCAMLVSACFYSKNPSAEEDHQTPTPSTTTTDLRGKQLADALVPLLRSLCAETPPFKAKGDGKLKPERKLEVWLVGALTRIEKGFEKEGSEREWIRNAIEKFSKRCG